MLFDRTVGRVRVVNAGSVGMPYCDTRARWALLGPKIELRRTAYDLEAAAERIRQTAYPLADELAAGNVLRSPPEEKVLAALTRVELT
jgi:hypothetical protein